MKTIAKVIFLPVYIVYRAVDKVSHAMMQAGPYANYGDGAPAAFPKCVQCRARQFVFATRPTFTTNRFGQQRITVFIDCTNCGMRHRAIRSAGTDWSYTEPS